MALVALITGASQGTGKATARLLAQKGYDLVLAARREDRLHTIAQDITALGHQAIAIPTDVGNAAEVSLLAKKALDHFGKVDLLVNNAGICLTGEMAQTSLEDWQQIMNTNVWGYVHTIQALLPQFLERGSGAIVNVGSVGGKMPLPHMTAYCTSKYAVTGLTETLRIELADKGIHVAAVHPGIINSDFLERAVFRSDQQTDAESRRQQMQSMLSGAWVSQPEDIAQAIWEAVDRRRPEIVVGAALWATEAYRLFPGLTQWALQSQSK